MRLSKPFTQTPTARWPKLNFTGWCGWAARSRLSPFRDLAKTVRQHWEGILAYFDTRLTSAAIEAVNGVIQLAKRMARGFRNFVYFRTAAYHRAGKLNLAVPTMT